MSLSLHSIHIQLENDKLVSLSINPKRKASIDTFIHSEIATYLKNPQHVFNVQMELMGTPFQLKVWKALQAIPTGKTVTYGALAKKLKTSPRAIGQACRTNPIPIIVPCHRIVAANGLGGYTGELAGKMIDVKAWLLEHESKM